MRHRRATVLWLSCFTATLQASLSAGLAGRATFYGNDDGSLNDGSCACAKRGGIRSACASQFCFDYIGDKLPKPGIGFTSAINTPRLTNTDKCGQCLQVKCVNGPTRGLPSSTHPFPACKNASAAVTVMITDSCPCQHPNPSNQKWCCGDATHFDLSYWAFEAIADVTAGVIDVEYSWVASRLCKTPQQRVNTDTCNKYHGIIVRGDLWKLGLGLLACLAAAAACSWLIVKALYF